MCLKFSAEKAANSRKYIKLQVTSRHQHIIQVKNYFRELLKDKEQTKFGNVCKFVSFQCQLTRMCMKY